MPRKRINRVVLLLIALLALLTAVAARASAGAAVKLAVSRPQLAPGEKLEITTDVQNTRYHPEKLSETIIVQGPCGTESFSRIIALDPQRSKILNDAYTPACAGTYTIRGVVVSESGAALDTASTHFVVQ